MIRQQAIIAATDFSESAQRAVERAAQLSKEWGTSLTLVYVFNDSVWSSIKSIYDVNRWLTLDPVENARQRLAEMCVQLKHDFGISVEAQVLLGRASKEIQKFVISRKAGLLVIGEHGENWVSDAVLGGTALKVLEGAAIPILLVKKRVTGFYQSVAIATDFSPSASRAARLTSDMFPTARHHLIHAYRVPFESSMRMTGVPEDKIQHYREQAHLTAVRNLETFSLDSGYQAADELSRLALHGTLSSVVFEQAPDLKIDLIAIGKHGGGAIEELLLGSNTRNILYHSDCDVLLSP